jgi:hypothetical protein
MMAQARLRNASRSGSKRRPLLGGLISEYERAA